jgi:hypothetical protein
VNGFGAVVVSELKALPMLELNVNDFAWTEMKPLFPAAANEVEPVVIPICPTPPAFAELCPKLALLP